MTPRKYTHKSLKLDKRALRRMKSQLEASADAAIHFLDIPDVRDIYIDNYLRAANDLYNILLEVRGR